MMTRINYTDMRDEAWNSWEMYKSSDRLMDKTQTSGIHKSDLL